MNELFPAETMASDSPRLRWMQEHGVQVSRNATEGVEDPWEAWDGAYKDAAMDVLRNGEWSLRMAMAATEDEALVQWATKNGVKLWNERKPASEIKEHSPESHYFSALHDARAKLSRIMATHSFSPDLELAIDDLYMALSEGMNPPARNEA